MLNSMSKRNTYNERDNSIGGSRYVNSILSPLLDDRLEPSNSFLYHSSNFHRTVLRANSISPLDCPVSFDLASEQTASVMTGKKLASLGNTWGQGRGGKDVRSEPVSRPNIDVNFGSQSSILEGKTYFGYALIL